MNQREIDAYLAGTLTWQELSPSAQYFVARLGFDPDGAPGVDHRVEAEQRIIQTRRHIDRLGPLMRITNMLDACSGMQGDWVSEIELFTQIVDDDFLSEWIDRVHEATLQSVNTIIGVIVETWMALELADALDTPVRIEFTVGPEGPMWRTVRQPLADPVGVAGDILRLLRRDHGALDKGTVQGRTHLSLPDLEVFVGVDLASAAERRPGHEAPLVLSAITGMEMPDTSELDDLLDEFVNHVGTPTDLTFEIVRGVGLQVWMDRIIDVDGVARVGLDGLVEDFLHHARTMQAGLAPYDRNPPDGGWHR